MLPAKNEADSLQTLLPQIRSTLPEAEIIVVDDGSSDATCDIVRENTQRHQTVKLIVQDQNRGKSCAVARGVREARGAYVLFLDADLIGLTARGIRDLIAPIRGGEADVAISMRENTPLWMKMGGLDIMSGERVLPRALCDAHLNELEAMSSFGLEVFLNRLVMDRKLRLRTVMLEGVLNDFKFHKRGFWRGVRGELLMWRDIFQTVSLFEFIVQIVRMRKLLV